MPRARAAARRRMVAPGRRVPDLPAQLRRLRRRRHRRPQGHHLAGPVPGRSRHRRGLAQPVLPVRPGRRRVRRRRLPRRRPAARHAGRLRRADRPAARATGSRSSSTSCRTTPRTGTPGSARRSPPRRDRRPGTGTSSATGWARTGRSRPRTGSPMFGGPAWTRVPDGQWYLHLFAAEQPDLNWENREVRDDFLTTLRFWSDRGVDGFRVDVAHGLAKNLAEPLDRCQAADLISARCAGSSSALGPRRGARHLRRMAAGLQRVRPAADGGGRGLGAPVPAAAVRQPARTGPGLQLRPARGELGRRGVPADHHRQPRRRAAARLVDDVGAVQPRRGPARHPLWAAAEDDLSSAGTPRRGCSATAPHPSWIAASACGGPARRSC